MGWLSVLLLLMAVPSAIAALVFLIEICAAILSEEPSPANSGVRDRPPVVVLIPAHDESVGILPTLEDVQGQLQAGDRLLVVADNCTDDTATVAAQAAAEVIERRDDLRRGKSYALDFGIRSLQGDDPSIVLVVDADCRLGAGAIDELARACGATGRPVQALYLMSAPEQSSLNHDIAEFAWRIKNDLRARGLAALGFPCQLMGSGMAFPRHAFAAVEMASGHLAEDLDLGLQLARAGYPPLFWPRAVVRSVFPTNEQAAATQRQRWEHGHFTVLARRVLPSMWSAVRDRNWNLLALSLDAAVPPLVFLAVLTLLVFLPSAVSCFMGIGQAPLIVSTVALTMLLFSLVLAFFKCGRDLLTSATWPSAAVFLRGKLGIYARAFASNKKWTRTGRGERH